MKTRITKDTQTSELKTSFMEHFEGLKIEFFFHSHEHEEGSPKKDMLQASKTLAELNPDLADRDVSLDGEMSVNQVEDFFENELGLHIQVFRKMNISWIETTATDKYSLNEQMRLSRESRGLS